MYFVFFVFIFMQYINTPPPEAGADYGEMGAFLHKTKFLLCLAWLYDPISCQVMQTNMLTARHGRDSGWLARPGWEGLAGRPGWEGLAGRPGWECWRFGSLTGWLCVH